MSEGDFIVRLKGLPWSAQESDIQEFFEDCKIIKIQTAKNENKEENTSKDEVEELVSAIHLVHLRDGRSSGEAFVEFESAKDLEKAMLLNKKHLGTRYVDIYKVKRQEMDYVLGHNTDQTTNGYLGANKKVPIVKLKGVPYDCSKEEISNFFSGLKLVPHGITIILDHYGRCNGQVFVRFQSADAVPEALKKNKNLIGHRYIEVFESTPDDLLYAVNKSQQFKQPYSNNNNFFAYYKAPYGNRNYNATMYDNRAYRPVNHRAGYHNMAMHYNNDHFNMRAGRGGYFSNHLAPRFMNGQSYSRMDKRPFIGGYIHRTSTHHSTTGHTIQMKGLPFSVTDDDIRKFFSPLEPVVIHIQQTPSGKVTGIAHVDFNNEQECQEALKKDKQHIDDRYIDLYLKSPSVKQAVKNADEEGTQTST